MKGVYKLSVYCGRSGSLEGVFIAEDTDIAKLAGRTVHFGEVLGKHSDVSIDDIGEHLELVSEDPNVVDVLLNHGLTSGFDPFDYTIEGLEQNSEGEWVVIDDQDEEEEDEDE